MIESWLPGIASAIIASMVMWFGHLWQRRSNRDTNKVQRDQLLLQARDTLIGSLQSDNDTLDKRLAALEATQARQAEEIRSQGREIRKLQAQEWWLRRYVHRLIDFIRANGLEPPEPPDPIYKEGEN